MIFQESRILWSQAKVLDWNNWEMAWTRKHLQIQDLWSCKWFTSQFKKTVMFRRCSDRHERYPKEYHWIKRFCQWIPRIMDLENFKSWHILLGINFIAKIKRSAKTGDQHSMLRADYYTIVEPIQNSTTSWKFISQCVLKAMRLSILSQKSKQLQEIISNNKIIHPTTYLVKKSNIIILTKICFLYNLVFLRTTPYQQQTIFLFVNKIW